MINLRTFSQLLQSRTFFLFLFWRLHKKPLKMRQNKKGNIFTWKQNHSFLPAILGLIGFVFRQIDFRFIGLHLWPGYGSGLDPCPKRFINSLCVGHCCNLGWLCSSISRWCFFVCCCTTSYADIFEKRSENCRHLKVCYWFKALFEYDTCFQPCWFKFEYNIKQGRRH